MCDVLEATYKSVNSYTQYITASTTKTCDMFLSLYSSIYIRQQKTKSERVR